MGSKMENRKSKTVMSWSSQKKKGGIFCPFILSKGNFFNIRLSPKLNV